MVVQSMKNISILVVENALIAAIGNARYMFKMVNDFLEESGQGAFFNVKLVGYQKEIQLNEGMFTIQVDEIFEEAHPDIIIIPPMSGAIDDWIELNRCCIPWLLRQYDKGTEIASLCVGAFLLAETGLLNGLECSTHWKTVDEFRRRFPLVNLVDYKIITEYNGIYTSGGSNSYWNLLVYLVEKFVDRDTAILTAKYFEVEIERNNQNVFMVFAGYKSHQDDQILQVQNYIEENYKNKLTMEELASEAALSTRTLQRRFKQATNYTIAEYIQKMKIEAAKKLFESEKLNVNDVLYEVGYADPKYFRLIFKKHTGMTPLEYRNKYLNMTNASMA
jgi:transcriptional regulator GlxA family with amidase domain